MVMYTWVMTTLAMQTLAMYCTFLLMLLYTLGHVYNLGNVYTLVMGIFLMYTLGNLNLGDEHLTLVMSEPMDVHTVQPWRCTPHLCDIKPW